MFVGLAGVCTEHWRTFMSIITQLSGTSLGLQSIIHGGGKDSLGGTYTLRKLSTVVLSAGDKIWALLEDV